MCEGGRLLPETTNNLFFECPMDGYLTIGWESYIIIYQIIVWFILINSKACYFMEKCCEKDSMSYGLRAFEFLGTQEIIRFFNKKTVTCTIFLIW